MSCCMPDVLRTQPCKAGTPCDRHETSAKGFSIVAARCDL